MRILIGFIGDGAWFLFGLAFYLLFLGMVTVSNALTKNRFTFKGWLP